MRKTKVSKIRDAEDIIRPAFFVPLKTTIEQVLRDFQKMKVHMAVVVDEKRKPVGVVTMEDVFNALFEG
jgi:CBS domain containing-hemolysin-like protein